MCIHVCMTLIHYYFMSVLCNTCLGFWCYFVNKSHSSGYFRSGPSDLRDKGDNNICYGNGLLLTYTCIKEARVLC